MAIVDSSTSRDSVATVFPAEKEKAA